MRWFWHTFIAPLLDVLVPRVVIEVGAETGAVTVPLLEWADSHDSVVHVIDPKPRFDVAALRAAHRTSFRFHGARSLRVLPRIAAADLVLIDGDHNWYTVINELRQLERRASRDERLPPLILLHDVEWPYARRDLYYDPEAIPARSRHPYARQGILPGLRELGEPGLNAALNNALCEGGAANGVLTAVEDFLAESAHSWELSIIPGLFGLGILAPRQLLGRRRRVRRMIEWTGSPEFLRLQCDAIERARIAATIRPATVRPATVRPATSRQATTRHATSRQANTRQATTREGKSRS